MQAPVKLHGALMASLDRGLGRQGRVHDVAVRLCSDAFSDRVFDQVSGQVHSNSKYLNSTCGFSNSMFHIGLLMATGLKVQARVADRSAANIACDAWIVAHRPHTILTGCSQPMVAMQRLQTQLARAGELRTLTLDHTSPGTGECCKNGATLRVQVTLSAPRQSHSLLPWKILVDKSRKSRSMQQPYKVLLQHTRPLKTPLPASKSQSQSQSKSQWTDARLRDWPIKYQRRLITAFVRRPVVFIYNFPFFPFLRVLDILDAWLDILERQDDDDTAVDGSDSRKGNTGDKGDVVDGSKRDKGDKGDVVDGSETDKGDKSDVVDGSKSDKGDKGLIGGDGSDKGGKGRIGGDGIAEEPEEQKGQQGRQGQQGQHEESGYRPVASIQEYLQRAFDLYGEFLDCEPVTKRGCDQAHVTYEGVYYATLSSMKHFHDPIIRHALKNMSDETVTQFVDVLATHASHGGGGAGSGLLLYDMAAAHLALKTASAALC